MNLHTLRNIPCACLTQSEMTSASCKPVMLYCRQADNTAWSTWQKQHCISDMSATAQSALAGVICWVQVMYDHDKMCKKQGCRHGLNYDLLSKRQDCQRGLDLCLKRTLKRVICVAGTTRASSLEELPPACSNHKNRSRPRGLVASHQGTLLWVCHGCHWQLSDHHSLSHLPITVLPQAL